MGRWEMVIGVTDPARWDELLSEGFEPFAVAYGNVGGVVVVGQGQALPIVSFKKFVFQGDNHDSK